MATRFLERMAGAAAFLSTLKNDSANNVAPILVDADDELIKFFDRTNSKVARFSPDNVAPVQATASTLTVTAALHSGRTVALNLAGGIAVTLPAAAGTGDRYRFVVQTTFTGAATIKVANANDYMIGTAALFQDAGDAVAAFATANSGTPATESDTITLFVASNTTGGIKGAIIELEDLASNIWNVRYVSDAGGTEATPFSATV